MKHSKMPNETAKSVHIGKGQRFGPRRSPCELLREAQVDTTLWIEQDERRSTVYLGHGANGARATSQPVAHRRLQLRVSTEQVPMVVVSIAQVNDF